MIFRFNFRDLDVKLNPDWPRVNEETGGADEAGREVDKERREGALKPLLL